MTFRTSAALAVTLSLGVCAQALSQPAPAAVITVTGSRQPLAADRLAADLLVISAERIAASSADSIEDLLRREAGLQLSRNGGPGQNASLLIRGSAAVNTVVLIDGVRIGSATLGLAQLEGLSLAQVERIEVLRGPGSSLHGADAVGGVVQIFTRRGDGRDGPPRTTLRLAAGGFGASEASLGTSAAVGLFDLAATLSREAAEGVSALRPGDRFGNHNPDRDGFVRRSAQLQLGVQPAVGQRLALRLNEARLNARYDASEFLPPTFAQNNGADFRNRFDTRLAALDYQAQWSPQWRAQVLLSDGSETLDSGGTRTTRYRTQRQQSQAQLAWTPERTQSWVFALEQMTEKATADDYAGDAQRRNQALLVAWSAEHGPWSLQFDLRHDDNSAYGGNDSGRVGVSLALSPRWRLRALAGTTFRAPSFNDLVYPGYGVPGIRPERGRSSEIGVNGRWGGGDVAATLWHNRVRDMIGYEPSAARCPSGPSYAFGCASNIGRARLQGLTLAAGQQWGGVALRGTLDLLDARDQISGSRLPRRAAHQTSLDATWVQGPLGWNAALLRLGTRPDGGKRLAAETTLNLQATWRVAPQWQLQARLINATDESLEPVRDYQGPGRQAWLALRWESRP